MQTTVDALLDRYVVEILPTLSERTQRDYSRYTIPHLRRKWGPRIADDIKPREFGEHLYSSPKGRIQRTRELAPLAHAYSCGKGMWWLCEHNPLAGLKKPKNPPRDRLIADQEFLQVLALAPDTIGLAMLLALYTGQRQGDLLRLKWSDVHDGAIHLQQSKTGKRLAISLHVDLKRVLGRCWLLPGGGAQGGEYVICSTRGTRYSSEGFRAMFTRVQRAYARGGGTRWRFHDIRALAATRCDTPEEARRLLGHTTVAMTSRVYRRGVERVAALNHDRTPLLALPAPPRDGLEVRPG